MLQYVGEYHYLLDQEKSYILDSSKDTYKINNEQSAN